MCHTCIQTNAAFTARVQPNNFQAQLRVPDRGHQCRHAPLSLSIPPAPSSCSSLAPHSLPLSAAASAAA